MSTSDIRQRAVIVAIPAVAGVVTAIAVIGWRTTLPDPLAIHFGANGRPDGSAGRNIFLWLTLNVTLVVIAIGVAGTLRAAGRSVVATWAAGTALLAWLVAGLNVWTVITERGVKQWTDARGPSAIALVITLGASIGASAVASRLDRVASAAAIDVRPAEWGGWGYRGSLRVLGKAAAVLRRGPGIRVDLIDGKVFAVTIDDAARGAGLLNDLVGRLATAYSSNQTSNG